MNCKNSLFSDTARAAQQKKVNIFFVAAGHIWQTVNIASGNAMWDYYSATGGGWRIGK